MDTGKIFSHPEDTWYFDNIQGMLGFFFTENTSVPAVSSPWQGSTWQQL